MQDQPIEPAPRHHRNRSDAAPWVVGGVLIVAGVFMLLRNVLGLDAGNWWALFILIPAIGSAARAWQLYRIHGELTEEVRGPLVGSAILFFVFAMLFFGFNWGLLWPTFLLAAGVSALIGVFARRH